MSGTDNAEFADLNPSKETETAHGQAHEDTPKRRTFAVPREFTNYDSNALTWRTGTALEIFERSAKVRHREPEAE